MTDTLLDLTTPEGIADAFVNHGVTLATLKGLSEEDLEAVYSVAYGHLVEERPRDALEDLVLLVSHEPWDSRFQFAYALALQMLEQYEAAARHYAQAFLMDPLNAGCALRMGECLEAAGDPGEAANAYRACIDLSFLDAEFHLVRAHAESRLAALDGTGASQ